MNTCTKNMLTPQATSSLTSWLNYIKLLHIKTIDLNLDRVISVAKNLNLLKPTPLVITVGGTNGKGTTCRIIETILLASGMRVGVYSSPHLLRYTERVRIQGNELPEASHSEVMAIVNAGRGNISLTYFEFSTLAALLLFQKASLDIIILEVGLGGRLDATNIINADISVITSIDLDHIDWLGPDRESIAREKAGIFRSGKPAIIGEFNRPLTLDSAIINTGAILYASNRDWWWCTNGKNWNWWNNLSEFKALPMPSSIPLENAATAVAVINQLPFSVSEIAVCQGLRLATLPGRFQFITQKPLTILDVAHNPHAARYLAKRLLELNNNNGKVRAIVGMLADKDIAGTLSCLHKLIDVWYCTSLNNFRAANAEQIAMHIDNNKAHLFNDVLSAWYQVTNDADPNDCIIVFGSFYTVAPILELIKNKSILY